MELVGTLIGEFATEAAAGTATEKMIEAAIDHIGPWRE